MFHTTRVAMKYFNAVNFDWFRFGDEKEPCNFRFTCLPHQHSAFARKVVFVCFLKRMMQCLLLASKLGVGVFCPLLT